MKQYIKCHIYNIKKGVFLNSILMLTSIKAFVDIRNCDLIPPEDLPNIINANTMIDYEDQAAFVLESIEELFPDIH